MKIRQLVFMLLLISLLGCEKKDQLPDEVNFNFHRWDSIIEGRGTVPYDLYFLNGQVEFMEIRVTDYTEESKDEYLYLQVEYDKKTKLLSRHVYPENSDERIVNYIYNEHGRLEEIDWLDAQGNEIDENSREYQYAINEDQVTRRTFKGGELILVEIETVEESVYELVLDYVDFIDSKYIVTYKNETIQSIDEEWLDGSGYTHRMQFSYDDKGNIVLITYESTAVGGKYLEEKFSKTSINDSCKVEIIDFRKAEPFISRTMELTNYDIKRNWRLQKLYDKDGRLFKEIKRTIDYF